MKNIIIFSFPRSGTHFLMNAISANFNYYSNRRMKLPKTDHIGKITEFFHGQCPTNRIFKSHMQSYSFVNLWSSCLNDYHIFYVLRDGKDAITSLYRFDSSRDNQIKKRTVGDFMRGNASNNKNNTISKIVYDIAIKKPTTVLDMWQFNVTSWIGNPNIFYVFYEDLINKFDDVVRAIGKYIDMEPPERIIKPSKTDNVIMPGPGIIGNYKNHFLDEDVLYFDQRTIATRALVKFNKRYLRY